MASGIELECVQEAIYAWELERGTVATLGKFRRRSVSDLLRNVTQD